MPVTSATATATPLVGIEMALATIAGGPFDNVSVFVQGGDTADGRGQNLYRLYALVGTLTTLVGESRVFGSPTPAILRWQKPGSGSTDSQFISAGGSSYALTVTALPTSPSPRALATATVAGVNEFDTAGDVNASSSLAVPAFTEVFSANVAGFAQLTDVSVNQAGLPQTTTISIYANNGPGSVEARVAQITLPGPDDVTPVLRQIQLPVASVYRVGVRNDSGGAITVPLGIATYSVVAAGGGGPVILTPAVGEVGVSGPTGANFIPPSGLFGQVLTTLGAPPTPTTLPLEAQWISPTNNPTWTQATWFVDPQNSTGLADDNNSGIDATHPVLSYNRGIVFKWGTQTPTLGQNTRITWLSSQVGDGDPVILTPAMRIGTLIIDAPLPTPVHSGVLAGVVARNRATAQLLTADLGFAASPGNTFVVNTTKNSCAWVDLSVAGTTFSLSQPMRTCIPPLDGSGFDINGAMAEDNTWANGDAFSLYILTSVNIVTLAPTVVEFDLPGNFPAQLQVNFINLYSPNGINGSDCYIGNDTDIIQCSVEPAFVNIDVNDDEAVFYVNTSFQGGTFANAGANPLGSIWAGRIGTSGPQAINWVLDYDAILDGTISLIEVHKLFVVGQPNPQNHFNTHGAVYIRGTVRMWGPNNFDPNQTFLTIATVWGPGILDTGGTARIAYKQIGANPAQQTFQNTGGLRVNGLTTAYAIATTDPAVWHPGRTLTALGLDTPVGPGNTFGGLATNPGGATFVNGAP